MAGAEAVSTNFFHGCVFALLNRRPFIAAPSAYRLNKVRDLLRGLGAERHMVLSEEDDSGIAQRLDGPPAAVVQARIRYLREQSRAFLRDALGAS